MINLKKIGLTALAGSLVAISAHAAEISVSGGVELTYVDTGGTHGNEVTGNSFGANSGVVFTGSGDVGFAEVSMTRAINDTNTGWGSSFQTLDMGDMGTFSFDSYGGALVGSTANDDLMPTAYEESWTGVGSSGISGVGSTNVLGYKNSYAGVNVSAGYTNAVGAAATGESASSGNAAAHGSITDIYVSTDAMEGLTIGAGYVTNSSTNTSSGLDSDKTEMLAQAVYSTGPFSVGFRYGEVDEGAAATADKEITGYSAAFNVNDNFSISYGVTDIETVAMAATAAVTNKMVGYSASYTVGAASVRVNHSTSDNDGGTKAVDDETTEIGVALSF
jgi:outer membrane protein OmpU